MRALSLAVVASLAASCAAAPETAKGASTWATGAQTWSQHLRGSRDIAYGPEPEQLLDVYEQGTWVGEPTYFVHPPGPRPTLIFFHGGGMVERYPSVESWTIPFLERGWNVVSPTYRIGPGTAPAGADDAVCALKWVADNAETYGFDTQRIVVSGASSGGQLALAASMLSLAGEHPCAAGERLAVRAIVNWYGVTDLAALASAPGELLTWVGDADAVERIAAAYSPLSLATAETPPVITLHGTADTVVPFAQAVALHERLDALGVRSELVPLEGGNHTGFTNAQTAEAFAAIGAFLDATPALAAASE
jgi:acetyl esterase/lipase